MSVPFKHNDLISHKSSNVPYTYIGEKGYGVSLQYVYYDPTKSRAYHFTEWDAGNYRLYVPGLVVGKQYRFNDTSTGNVYRVLHEYKNPDTGFRTWQCEITVGRDGVLSSVNPYNLTDNHLDRLTLVDDEDEW